MTTAGIPRAASVPPRGDLDWREQAACIDADPNIFFDPDGAEDPGFKRRRILTALTYCASCPVIEACLEAALVEDNYARYGIRGGLTGEQRAKIHRKRRRKAAR